MRTVQQRVIVVRKPEVCASPPPPGAGSRGVGGEIVDCGKIPRSMLVFDASIFDV